MGRELNVLPKKGTPVHASVQWSISRGPTRSREGSGGCEQEDLTVTPCPALCGKAQSLRLKVKDQGCLSGLFPAFFWLLTQKRNEDLTPCYWRGCTFKNSLLNDDLYGTIPLLGGSRVDMLGESETEVTRSISWPPGFSGRWE